MAGNEWLFTPTGICGGGQGGEQGGLGTREGGGSMDERADVGLLQISL